MFEDQIGEFKWQNMDMGMFPIRRTIVIYFTSRYARVRRRSRLRSICATCARPCATRGSSARAPGLQLPSGCASSWRRKLGGAFVKLSPLFIYYEERVLEHSIREDAGAMPRDGMKVLVKMGCAPEIDDRYRVRSFKKAPSALAMKDAAQFKVASYHRLSTLRDMQACLAGGSGFVMGFTVYESFESLSVAETGKMPMPKHGEGVAGGHAVFAAGYQTDPSTPGGGYLIVKNSWGKSWGDSGYFYMPFAYVTPTAGLRCLGGSDLTEAGILFK